MKFFVLLLCAIAVFAQEIRFDLLGFVEQGLKNDPQVDESKFAIETKKNKLRALKADVIFPTLNLSMMIGPAPGLKEDVEADGDTIDVYDFTKMGPFWGVTGKFVQPLNLGQYRMGKQALEADMQQKQMSIEHDLNKKNVELQTYYYNYLLAKEMKKLASEAEKQVNRAYDQMEEALDEDDPNVSQMDFLNLKAQMHTVKEGVIEADLGMKRVLLAIKFSLNLQESELFVAEDSALTPRKEPLPLLEEVRALTLTHHPELKQLSAGLLARRTQMKLAEAKLAPEFFIMGEFQYVKSWAGNRKVMQKSAFAEDAVNKLDGAIGIGLRYRLNVWKYWEDLRVAKTEYQGLQLKDKYAADGLMAKAEEQYYLVVAARDKMEALKESLRASEAILKGAAMQYDLDKSKTKELVSAFTQNMSLQKDYYFAVCKYNVEFASLIYKMGFSLKEFHDEFVK